MLRGVLLMFPSLVKKDAFTKAKRMGAGVSSSLMSFSTHLLALEPNYDNEKYKASPSLGVSPWLLVSEEPERHDWYHINNILRYFYS